MSGGDLETLADLVGVASGYHDVFGGHVEISAGQRAEIMARLGFPSASEQELAGSIALAREMRGALVPRTIAVTSRRAAAVPLRKDGPATWRLVEEGGRQREGRAVDGRIELPPLTPGYHRLSIVAGSGSQEATVIAAPARCWEPAWMRDGGRAWGLAAQIYGLRSQGNLGIGTYRDLKAAAESAAPLGASFLGLSPVHALFAADRTKLSPYSPSSRLFLETLHIDPAALPGFAGSAAARLLAEEERAGRIAALREAALVDHDGIWFELAPVLEAYFAERREALAQALARFRRAGGAALEAHAVFEALSEHFRRDGLSWLGEWPDEFRRHDGLAVAAFARDHAERVAFHAWLQQAADDQLAEAQRAALAGGMSIGLYRDLAVGSDRGGSELWSSPGLYGQTLSIGAPPDLLAPQGQDWGLSPLHPLMLEASGLRAFRALVQANMRHAGAIRIDHAFQLQRLYLIPVGEGGQAGAYVSYPFDAMLAVLRLESHRARALVIAEDLGTAPEGFSDAIMASGILSYRVLAFERGEGGSFKRPADYPREAMTVATTHDLPTLAGWWRGLDTDLRQGLGIYEPDRADRERQDRVVERRMLSEALDREGLLPGAEVPETVPGEAVLRYLARTPSALMAVQYEDVVGALNQPNLPGTTEGHPNWRRKLDTDLDAITAPGGPLAKIAATIAGEGRGPRGTTRPLAAPPPRATYRIQFHKDFTFDDAILIVPYLAQLGISHLYASPIHKARPGSTHGYDIVDHAEINPELGGEEGFLRLSDALKADGLGLILDIVPNHMGVGGSDNAAWLSVLEWGPLSAHAQTFDIDWERLGAGGKLVVPVLGERYGEALENGTLELRFDPEEGSFSVHHYEHRLPLAPPSYPLVLDRALSALDGLEGHEAVIAVSEGLRAMQEERDAERRRSFPEEAEAQKRRLAQAVAASPEFAGAIERAVRVVNGIAGTPESYGTLHRILDMQAYRPAHWRVAASDINYRRFFDINGLAGVRVEEPTVFDATHELILRLVREGRIQGLRIDHVDGLADPEGYLRRLQQEAGPGFYILVEKILEPGEALRDWPISGTTGYEVLNLIDGVLLRHENAARIEAIYRDFAGLEGRYFDLLRGAKIEILQSSFASELEVLVSDLKRIADADRRTRDYTAYGIRVALSEIVARFPVYRSYVTDDEPSADDVALIEETVAAARRHSSLPDHSVHDFAADCLLGRIETNGPGRPAPDHVARFRRRFQQLTGPVMAKSLEDTLFYRYAPLLALNEVGGDPAEFGGTLDHFHAENLARSRQWPDNMIATATHDTKRGEDARARLLALSELPEEWEAALRTWREVTSNLIQDDAPDANDQIILLQAILGAWPLELLERESEAGLPPPPPSGRSPSPVGGGDEAAPPVSPPPTGEEDHAQHGGGGAPLSAFESRLQGFVEKALREAKRHSSWVNVDEDYEGATKRLVSALLSPGSAFLDAFRPLAARLAEAGMRNGLVRTVLKATLPGVPDIYQGTEFWDFSLVDPDNRRPVDYAARLEGLAEIDRVAVSADDDETLADSTSPHRGEGFVSSWTDGRIKQAVLTAILTDRAATPALYASGDYRPIRATDDDERAVAFARRAGGEEMAVVALRFPGAGEAPAEARITLPTGEWRELLTRRAVAIPENGIALRELFGALPVAVLRRTA